MTPALAPTIALGMALLASPSTDLFAHAPTVDKFDNGLTLVTLEASSPGTVAYFTLVRAGSRDEVEPGKSGYAHLFEHLMFRGTEKMSSAEYERKMQSFGADNNAFTTEDFTLYVPTLPKESLPELVRLEAERFMHLSYKEAAYKDETGAVLGEYNKTAANPRFSMSEALQSLAFTAHTYGHTVIGWKLDVEAMPAAYEYSREFFRRFYTPDDCTIFVVGDVDRAAVRDMVQAAYGGWTGHRAVTAAKPEPEQTAPRSRAITWKGPTLPRLLDGFKIPATGASIADAAALEVVAALTFGDSSDLYQRLVVKEEKLLELSADPQDVLSRDPGLFTIEAKLKSDTTFDEVVKAIDEALAKVARGDTPQSKLEATKSHLANDLVLSLQTPQSIGIALARWMAATGDVQALQTFKSALSSVSAEDVARVAKTYLVPARRNVVTLVGPTAASAPAATPKAGPR
jgi:zinc protease